MKLYILWAFILSLICGVFFTPAILDYCKRKKLYDIPNERKIHTKAVPRLGGISFFPSMMLAFAAILFLLFTSEDGKQLINTWSASYLLGLGIIYLTGIVDDLTGLKANTKFLAQICAATLLPLTGLYINNLYGMFGIYEIPVYVGIPLTIFVIVFVDNAINLIDGIDGLAGCISLLALGGFLAYFVHYQVFLHTYSVLVAGMMGALVAFLYFNLFGSIERNTKIFMGDSGSLSLGFTLGFLTIKTIMDNPEIWPMRPEAILVPLTLLFVPSADVVRVTLYRLFHHKPLFDADKNHIHHKLMKAGLSQHQALVFILVYMLCVIAINRLLFLVFSVTAVILTDVAVYIVINIGINRRIHTQPLKEPDLDALPTTYPEQAMQAKAQIKPAATPMDDTCFIKDGMGEIQRNLKRLLDFLASAVCLIVFSPLFLVCYIAVKREDGGPAIFKQERIGRFGRPFYIYKFRSMRVDAEKDGPALYQHGSETRMTKVGKFLREHHLDELPQLWNVFKGEMAFIGPRPERKFYIDQIMRHDPRYVYLYQVRPGVTSYATLYNGYTDTMEKMLRRLELDLYYLEHRSLWFDATLLVKTFLNIAFGKKF